MAVYRVINRYATALIEIAIEQNKLDVVYNDATSFLNACNSSRELLILYRNPTIQTSKKIKITDSLFKGKFDDITREFIKLVVRHKREIVLVGIFNKFIALYKDHNEIVDAEVVSAVTLDNKILEQLKNHVMTLSNAKDVDLKSLVDENIIGGFALKFGDKVLDMSLASELKALKEHLKE